MKTCDKKLKIRGTTLVELLVAVTVFAILIGAISGLLVSALRIQARILSNQELLNQAGYVLEYISRSLRMAVKDTLGTCLVSSGYNYWVSPGPSEGNSIRLLKSTPAGNICQEFSLESGHLYERKSIDENRIGFLPGEEQDMISINFQIVSFQVNVSGDVVPAEIPNLQPRVTILLEVKRKGSSIGQPTIKVQTSISQRSLDI